MSTVVVLAKSPVPGRVKTRLSPPFTPAEAAAIADAALRDTLDAATASRAHRRVLVLDGAPGPWLPRGWQVEAQACGDLGMRLDAAFRVVPAPALLVGMDTPQLRARDLDGALDELDDPGCDAVLGPSLDGGFWAIGFTRRVRGAFTGVPMSEAVTFAAQRARLDRLGLRVHVLPAMRDVDRFEDAVAVARLAPHTRVARAVGRLIAAGRS
jgi:rSAM/selenodomain-associated transferase 1